MTTEKLCYIETVVNLPLYQSFTYSCSDEDAQSVSVGKRVEVRFGNRRMTAFVIRVLQQLPEKHPVPPEKIKSILKVLDKDIVFTEEHIELSLWMARYYLCSQGEALATMIPSGRRETDTPGFFFEEDGTDFSPKTLSQEQQKAVEDISNSRQGLHYLYGPTGTGKTEVFLSVAERILSEGKGIIYLVPEIGLTHQVIESVVKRFGQKVAVIHSELTPSQRLKEWHRIINKEATVVIGARSAVFAPVPDLGLIIMDEEHDSSYKSGTTPRYHGRQIAMIRCRKKNIPLVMGSATPSMEAWHLMEQGSIQKHTLTNRLAGGKPPEIRCVDLTKSTEKGCLSVPLVEEMRKTLAEKRQIILFLNRRGFTHFFRCNTCGYELKCKNCSVALTYHKSENRLRCHYCGWTVHPPTICPQCASVDVGYSGFGTEFIESETKAKFPDAKITRIDTDSLTKKGELQERLTAFRKGDIDILLGTQMVAKGLNFPNLKLVGVVLADTGLHMPDFRSAERTFALITQVAGRAGRFFPDGKVIVQTYDPLQEVIDFACKGKIKEFYDGELQQRELLGFSPFSRMIRFVFRSSSEEAAADAAKGAADILLSQQHKLQLPVDILGPSPCPLSKISANYRWQIILRGEKMHNLHLLGSNFFFGYKTPPHVYIEADVDPVNLL